MELTVIVPARNEQRAIGRCLDALRMQVRPGVELIVADDGSTDTTARVVLERFPEATVLRLPPRGPAAARAAALAEARSPRIAFIDADCVPDPGWLEAALRGRGLVMGRVRPEPSFLARLVHLLEFGEFLGSTPRPLRNFALLNLSGPTEVFRGLPLPDIAAGEDRLWAWRLVRAGHEIAYDPAQAVLHAPPLAPRILLRRQVAYARRFIAIRRIDPTIPGGRLLRLGPFAAPLLAGGRFSRDLGRLARVRRDLGIGVSLPLHAGALAALRALDALLFVHELFRSA